ncbi:hypothetical protein [Sedimentibacter sp.]|uniref:prenylated flavin chaperone LpdD n=1 Tax=Sedimentibacter sp. TaxID=1960295 RepID=UPI0028A75E24|nr:hypothetical protein [Sedimentibacter sp.]
MIRSFKLSEGTGKCIIEAIVVNCGNDLSVTIGGGEKYHIGAVSVAVPRFEYKDGEKRTASTSVICVQGHREDELAYKTAKKLATALDCTVTVSIGAHIDNIKQNEFHEMIDNVNILLDRIIEDVKKNR